MRYAPIWRNLPQGLRHVERLAGAIEEGSPALPELARSILRLVVAQLNDTQAKVRQIEAKLAKWHRSNRVSKLLATVPGVGIMGASAIAATVSDPNLFRSGREFAAWLGMTPRQNSSGGKERLGRTSKRGDKYIRCLLVAGAVAVLRHARNRATKDAKWVRALLARRPAKSLSGTKPYFFKSLRINLSAARLFLLVWTSTSRTSPSASTARHR